MRLKWTKTNVARHDWWKVTINGGREYNGSMDGRQYWTRLSCKPKCKEIIAYLTEQDVDWMFNPQDYLMNVQFAVDNETTAIYIRMMSEEGSVTKMS